jgi:hypothetical protein
MSGKRFLTPLRWFTLGLLLIGVIAVGVVAHLNNDGSDTPVSPALAGLYGQDIPPSSLPESLQPGLVLTSFADAFLHVGDFLSQLFVAGFYSTQALQIRRLGLAACAQAQYSSAQYQG